MRPKSMLLLALALGCGLVAAIGFNQYMLGQKADQTGVDRSMVVVAAQEIPRGTMITEDLLTLKKWPSEDIPEGAVSDYTKVTGRVAKSKLFANEIVLNAKLAEEGTTRDIPEGMRLVSVKVDYWSVASGFVLPGDRVDIILIHQNEAKPILENAAVWAVDQKVDRGEPGQQPTAVSGAQGVTLLVTAQQAVMLALVGKQGQLHLTLRSELDDKTGASTSVTLSEVLNGQASAGADRVLQQQQPAGATNASQRGSFGSIINNLLDDGEKDKGESWKMDMWVGAELRDSKEFQMRPKP